MNLARLTHKQLEMHVYITSTVATAAMVLKHPTNSINSNDEIITILDQFHNKILHLLWKSFKDKIFIFNQILSCLRVDVIFFVLTWQCEVYITLILTCE